MFIFRLGEMIEVAKGIVKVLNGTADAGYVPPPHPEVHPVVHENLAIPRQDMSIARGISLYQMTVTTNAALQGKNRILTEAQIAKLRATGALLNLAEDLIGAKADVHSGYRCPELNAATLGSATKSQHMLCEAGDWSIKGSPDTAEAVEAPFQKLWQAARQGKIRFGQLIVENAQRSYGRVYWIHISLGRPYRDPARCGEVLRMVTNAQGKPVYTMIGKVS